MIRDIRIGALALAMLFGKAAGDRGDRTEALVGGAGDSHGGGKAAGIKGE